MNVCTGEEYEIIGKLGNTLKSNCCNITGQILAYIYRYIYRPLHTDRLQISIPVMHLIFKNCKHIKQSIVGR